jgi:hypothetical protein
MKVGDMVFAEHLDGAFWVGLVIEINDADPDFFQCRVFWNDGDKTWEDVDTILTPQQKEDLEEMADK